MGKRITEAALEAAREALVAGGSLAEAAEAADVSVQTICKYRKEGLLPGYGENVRAIWKPKLPPLKAGERMDGTPEIPSHREGKALETGDGEEAEGQEEDMKEAETATETEKEIMDILAQENKKTDEKRNMVRDALGDINRAIEDMYRLQTGPMDEMNGVDNARRDELLPEFYELAVHLENIRARVFAEYVDWTKVYENMQ